MNQLLDSNSCIFVLMFMSLLLLLFFDLFCGLLFLKKMLNYLGSFLPQHLRNSLSEFQNHVTVAAQRWTLVQG